METINFSPVMAEDLAIGDGTQDVRLADGSVVTLNKVNLGIFGLPWRLPSLHAAGSGTEGDPWVGWEGYVNASPEGARIHFAAGYYSQATQINGKNRWHVTGDGRLVSVITVAAGIKGWVFDLDFGYAGVCIEHIKIIGNPASTLELIEVSDFIDCTIQHCFIEGSIKSGIYAHHGINLAIRDVDVNVCRESFIYLGGPTLINDFVNCFTIENPRCATTSGNVPANGGIRIQNSGYGCVYHPIMEMNFGGLPIRCQGAAHVDILRMFCELGDTVCVQGDTAACVGVRMIGGHYHSSNPHKIDFSPGSLAHASIIIYNVSFKGVSGVSQLFFPGASTSYDFRFNDADGPPLTWVSGWDNSRRDVTHGLSLIYTGGISIGDWLRYIVPSGDNLHIRNDYATGQINIRSKGSVLIDNEAIAGVITLNAGAGGGVVDAGAGGMPGIRVDAAGTGGFTRLLLWDVTAGTLRRVSVETADLGTGSKSYLYLA